MKSAFKIEWIDYGTDSEVSANPAFPEGLGVDISAGEKLTCQCVLPYPAKRCGIFHVTCTICDFHFKVETFGRADDTRIVICPCKIKGIKN